MSSIGGSPEGDRPYLSKFNLKTKKSDILFRSEAPQYERPMDIISKKTDRIITLRESEKGPPNYFIRDMKKGTSEAITDFRHPQPDLLTVNKELIKYKRADGVDLTAVAVPLLVATKKRWTSARIDLGLSREYKSKSDTRGQVRGSPYSFTRVSSGHPYFGG